MAEGKKMVMVTAAKRHADKKRTASKLKRGRNWEYAFTEKVMPDGTRKTLIVERQQHCRKYGTDVIVSNYTGAHPYEDAAIEAICDAFRDFLGAAREAGVACREVRDNLYFTAWLVDAPIDSEIVKAFAAALATINRVIVDVKVGPGGSSMP